MAGRSSTHPAADASRMSNSTSLDPKICRENIFAQLDLTYRAVEPSNCQMDSPLGKVCTGGSECSRW